MHALEDSTLRAESPLSSYPNPPTNTSFKTVRLFHLDVFSESPDSAADHCVALARDFRSRDLPPALVFAINPEKTVQASRDPAAQRLLARATMLIPDGIGVCAAARLLHGIRLARVPGSELMPAICARAEGEGLSVYVYGASAASNAGAVAAMRRRWPALRIAGASDGFQAPEAVAEAIARTRPDIVFVGLGSPRQERWMAQYAEQLPVGLMQGVGGTLDVLSGTARRAPPTWRRLGLEWLYRLLESPSRWRRQLALLEFIALVTRQRLRPRAAEASPAARPVRSARPTVVPSREELK